MASQDGRGAAATVSTFPILGDDELLPCLSEMEISLDPNHMAKPSYEIVRPVFEHIVMMLTGVTREELTQPVFTAMDVFEYPELHDESIAFNNFFRQLCKLMSACGVKDFSCRDVFKPEPPRLRRHLSAIINFAKFREERAVAYQEMQADLDVLGESIRVVEEEHARHRAELERMRQRHTAQAAEVAAVEAEEGEITARNQALNKQAAALQTEVRALKAQSNSLADAASQAKLDLAAAQQERAALEDQVVQSPDKHRKAIADLASAAEDKRLLCAQLSSQSITNERRMEMVTKFEKELSRCIKLLEELDAVVARKKGVSQQVKDMREQITVNERALGEVTNTAATLRAHQATVMDKIQRVETQAALKLEAAESYVEEALVRKAAVEAENAAAEARAAEEEAVIRSTRERMQEISGGHEAAVRAITDKYSVLRQAVSDYNHQLLTAINASKATQGAGFGQGRQALRAAML